MRLQCAVRCRQVFAQYCAALYCTALYCPAQHYYIFWLVSGFSGLLLFWLSLAFLILAKTGKAILQNLSTSIALIPFILIQLLSIINEFFYLKYTVSENEKHNYLIDYMKIIGDIALMAGAVSLTSVSFGAPFSVTIIGYSFFIGGFLQFSIWEMGEGWHKFLEAKKTFLFDLEGLGGLEGLKEILVKTCN